ncbi:uncharacterized protein LOC113227717 [Hyposmocoma kahamanoa]|uniref:uncharacterized protein LOC113227717 n=1 Tax=Hyposmocoma kahamanoa TaxID=1477025 RepID=UPI000E6D8050|nr:uncharacterized protein LOC113227717 [Hyposmocoma kahamanoa]
MYIVLQCVFYLPDNTPLFHAEMASVLPITIAGDNLGKRHQQLNSLVNECYKQQIPLDSVLNTKELSPVDRFFIIDLASRHKTVDYILRTLKDEDMLYVSRALKSTWLLDIEYKHIINPIYLEDVLYPEMITTAVTKMKNWVQHHLKDTSRCEEFYQYYFDKDVNLSIRFLWHCSNDFILINFKHVMDKIKPKQFKKICEYCPEIAKVFFDSLENNKTMYTRYTSKEKEFFVALKTLLKKSPAMYLDIVEKYFNTDYFGKMSPEATKFIMENHKDRFNKKPELYASRLLDIKTLAKLLNAEEIKELVIKLARASYLSHWFEYKSVEPFIKVLSADERKSFKKKIFVDKDVGEKVEKWPYEIPKSPYNIYRDESTIFNDCEHTPDEYLRMDVQLMDYTMLDASPCSDFCNTKMCPRKTSLDVLYETYRFDGFEKTFSELKKNMTMADSKHRQYMMLVLVSKTGGRTEHLEELLKFLVKHENEPDNFRATIVRSLVRRSNVWRVSQSYWDLFMVFAHDIGLDGKPSTVPCKEGIHAVVLRKLLEDAPIDPLVWDLYVKNFSDLKEYSLNKDEKEIVKSKLPVLLLSAAQAFLNSDDPAVISKATENLNMMIDINRTFRYSFDNPQFNETMAKAVRKDKDAEQLLKRLFNAKINRRKLFQENFAVIQNNASYLNALKHDIKLLESAKEFKILVEKGTLKHDKFLEKLALYFNEGNGLAEKYLSVLEKAIEKSPRKTYARPIAILAGKRILSIVENLDKAPKYSDAKKFGAVLRGNVHKSRPLINLNAVDWRWLGAKCIANRKLNTSKKDANENIDKLLSWNRTTKLAVFLAMKIGKEAEVLAKFAERRPRCAVRIVTKHWSPFKMDAKVWDVLLSLIRTMNISELKPNLRSSLILAQVPKNLEQQYYAALYEAFKKDFKYHACAALCVLENNFPDVDSSTVESILTNYLKEDVMEDNLKNQSYSSCWCHKLYIRVIAKFLLLSKNEDELKHRFTTVGEPFFKTISDFKKVNEADPESKTENANVKDFLETFTRALRWNRLFLKSQDALCLKVQEVITDRMQKIWPLDMYFESYVGMHLTMLYFKSIRQGMKNNPKTFEKLPEQADEAADIVGVLLGKYVAREILQLIDKYFDSIKHLYKVCFYNDLQNKFDYNNNRNIFVTSIVKGILSEQNGNSYVLAEHLFSNERHNIPETSRKEILELLKHCNYQEVEFFLYSNLK